MELLTFQKPNKYHFLFLGYFFTIIFRYSLNNAIKIQGRYKPTILFVLILLILSHFLSFIPYAISRYLSKKKERLVQNKVVEGIVNNKRPKKYKWHNLIKPIFILSVFGFFSDAPMVLFNLLSDKVYNDLYKLGIYSILNAVLIYIFAYFILKIYFYRHHYLSFGINTICFLISLTIDIVKLITLRIDNINYYLYVIIRIIRLILICLLYCYSKKEFESSLLTPYSIIAFRAIFESIFMGIFCIPFAFIKIKDFKSEEKEIIFKVYGEYFTGIRLLYTILMFINDYLGDIFMFQIIDKFSVSHAALAYTLDSFAGKLYQIIADNVAGKTVSWEVYVNFCVYFLVFIGAMIHNEIFIINKCGLNEKTQLYLDDAFRKESKDNEEILKHLDDDSSIDTDKSSVEMNYVK